MHTKNLAYTLNYDTLYGRLLEPLKVQGNFLIDLNDNRISVQHKEHIDEVNWADYEVDYVIDSSGVLDNVMRAKELTNNNVVNAGPTIVCI